jgi:hypothetical protein
VDHHEVPAVGRDVVPRYDSVRPLDRQVDEAFRAVLRERARREEVESLSTMRGMDLDADDIMAGAWRPRRSPRSGSCCTTTPTSTASPR